MPDLQNLLLFLAAALVLNLTPGPDVLCIVTHAARGGMRMGAAAALGVATGCFVHIFAATAGVGALLATSSVAFTVLKWIGAGYLVWSGTRMLLARRRKSVGDPAKQPSIDAVSGPAGVVTFRGAYWRGFLTNALNPKVALFFLAFLPQFIDPATAHPSRAFFMLGLIFMVNSLPIDLCWAYAASWLARRARAAASMAAPSQNDDTIALPGARWLERFAGVMFIGFGARLALSDNPASAAV